MQFSEIRGQEKVKKTLIKSVVAGRIPHAQMFVGVDGNGSLPLAIAYSAYVNCENKTDEDSCGTCNSCHKHKQLIHPDVTFSFPTFGAKATTNDFLPAFREMVKNNKYASADDWRAQINSENKQLNINRDQCHEIIKAMSYKPFESQYKTLILWLPEFLGNQGNILLKLIEEPPPNTLFLLCTSNTDKLLTTIVSRSQIIKLQIPTADEIREEVSSVEDMTPELAGSISLLAEGSINKAYRLSRHMESSHFAPLKSWLQDCFKGKADLLNKQIQEMSSRGREDLKSFLHYGVHIVRACVLQPFGTNDNKLSKEEAVLVNNLAPLLKGEKGEQAFAKFNDAIYWLERNGNVKIVLFDLSLALKNILRK
jgi:DNA polymerase-3 subunit delta'